MHRHVDQINYIAIELLEKLGNIEPTEYHIGIIESILLQIVPSWRRFDEALTLVEIIPILSEC